jgi:hypothetical protein
MLHQDPLDFPPMPLVDNLLVGHECRFFETRQARLGAGRS